VIGDGRGRVGFIAWVEAAEKGGGEAPFTAADLRCERAPVRLIFFSFWQRKCSCESVRWFSNFVCSLVEHAALRLMQSVVGLEQAAARGQFFPLEHTASRRPRSPRLVKAARVLSFLDTKQMEAAAVWAPLGPTMDYFARPAAHQLFFLFS
jgi:hypothetical protein